MEGTSLIMLTTLAWQLAKKLKEQIMHTKELCKYMEM